MADSIPRSENTATNVGTDVPAAAAQDDTSSESRAPNEYGQSNAAIVRVGSEEEILRNGVAAGPPQLFGSIIQQPVAEREDIVVEDNNASHSSTTDAQNKEREKRTHRQISKVPTSQMSASQILLSQVRNRFLS